MDADGHSHQHMLRSLNDFATDFQQIASLQCLKAEVIVMEVSVINDGRVKSFGMSLDDFVDAVGYHRSLYSSSFVLHFIKIFDHFGEVFLSFFMQIRDHYSSGQFRVVGVFGGHSGRDLSRQFVQLNSCYARIETRNDLKRWWKDVS